MDKDAKNQAVRVYSYVALDGTVFWSFTKLTHTVSRLQLVLQSKNGSALQPFQAFMREQALNVPETPDDSSSGQ